MIRSLAAAIVASVSRLAGGRRLSVVVKARSSRITGGATRVSVRLPDALKPTTCGEKPAASTPRLGQRASAGGGPLAEKVLVSLGFDAAAREGERVSQATGNHSDFMAPSRGI